MTDAEWPKPGDLVAVRAEVLDVGRGWIAADLKPGRGYLVYMRDVAPWRSAEEVRAAEAVIEEVRDAMEWWGTGARERLILKLAAYDRAREDQP